VEEEGEKKVRVGLRFVRGLREEIGKKIVSERGINAYTSIADLIDRVAEINKREIRALSLAGALNFGNTIHRREALWESELAIQPESSLFVSSPSVSPGVPRDLSSNSNAHPNGRATETFSRIEGLDLIETDLQKTGISIGKHPMAFVRDEMRRRGILSSNEIQNLKRNEVVSVAGAVIIRQRPMTAKNVVFLTLEDETGFSNFVVMPDTFEQYRAVINQSDYLVIRGIFEERGMLKALHFTPIQDITAKVESHNFR
jgi:error-prone DNA polymerase